MLISNDFLIDTSSTDRPIDMMEKQSARVMRKQMERVLTYLDLEREGG